MPLRDGAPTPLPPLATAPPPHQLGPEEVGESARRSLEPTGEAEVGARRRQAGEPLRLLCLGRLTRASGALDLLEALLGADTDGWELTLAGADSATATTGASIVATAAAIAGSDPRLRIEGAPDETRLAELLADHDVLVAPRRLLADAGPALRAAAGGLALLATPAADLAPLLGDGRFGWLAETAGAGALRRALEPLLADPDGALAALAPPAERAARARELAGPEAARGAYEKLLAERPAARTQPAAPGSLAAPAASSALAASSAPGAPGPSVGAAGPLVTGVVPYYGAHAHVEEAVASLLAQTHERLEVLIVNDGSFAPEDAVLDRLAADPRVRVVTRVNAGETSARNLGGLLAHGEFVALLDADNAFEPEFVARALALYASRPDVAYVTCWLRMITAAGEPAAVPSGFAPLGNRVHADDELNFDGDTLSLVRRSLFTEPAGRFDPEGAMHSDWELWRRLRAQGRYGAVMPEPLARYRVRPDSLMRSYSGRIKDLGWRESLDRRELFRAGVELGADG